MKNRKDGYLELIDPMTLINTFAPWLLGILYTLYNYHVFNLWLSVEMLVASAFLQLALNMNDDFWDNRKSKALGINDPQNPISSYGLNKKLVLSLIIGFLLVSMGFAFAIGFQTNLIIWIVGIFCYVVAIGYSTGRHSISGTPYGEGLAGIAMGFGIFFVTAFLNINNVYPLDWNFAWKAMLASGVSVACTFNLLLANNISDAEPDIAHGRQTIVSYLGIRKSCYLLAAVYVIGYFASIIATVVGCIPWTVLVIELFIIPYLVKQVKFIFRKQIKQVSFAKILNTNILLSFGQILGLVIWLIA
ncbi:prenyltransferase [Lactobacillus sp. PV034]|uniref:prenyltransferase n=1 Tax=Lactobacillus sp. PV034 TaxID=2594495 RepID=UPI002240D8B0|nr:prenyltransferase [Lactobacillus sp. PV034]QNQ80352.1 prenyltransferase [Lactobacillus sp. PV034]